MAFIAKRRLANINRDLSRGVLTDQFERTQLAEQKAKEATQRASDAEGRLGNDSASFKLLDAICDVFDVTGSMNLPQPVRTMQRELHRYLTVNVSERSQPDLIKRIRTIAALSRKDRTEIDLRRSQNRSL